MLGRNNTELSKIDTRHSMDTNNEVIILKDSIIYLKITCLHKGTVQTSQSMYLVT